MTPETVAAGSSTFSSIIMNCCCLVGWLLLYIIHECRERATAHRTIRRNEKKVKELLNNIEDERKQGEAYKADVRKLGVRKKLSRGREGEKLSVRA